MGNTNIVTAYLHKGDVMKFLQFKVLSAADLRDFALKEREEMSSKVP